METWSGSGTEGQSPSERVIYAVAGETGESATDLDPLYETVDPDALDALATSPGDGCRIEFEYHGCRVSVGPDGVHVASR